MPTFKAEQLRALYMAFIEKLGGSREEAETFADMLVTTDLRGTDWQGLVSLNTHFISPIRDGIMKLGQEITVVKETPALILLDGKSELGVVAYKKAMELAVKKAKESGVGVVSMRNSTWVGIVAYYTMMALEHDCIGIITNTSRAWNAPWGGNEKIIGMLPFSIAIPAGKERPIIVDMSVASPGTLRKPSRFIPPFEIPEVSFFSSVREYCYAIALEVLSGALTGTELAEGGGLTSPRGQCGVFCMAIHIPHFLPMSEFKERMDRYIARIKSSTLADGFSEILIPGERAVREQERRLNEGIPVPDEVWDYIKKLADEVGVDWNKAIGST